MLPGLQSDARQAMLDFRHVVDLPEGRLVIATILQAQVQATTNLLTTCFSEAMNYPPIYRRGSRCSTCS